VAICLPATAHAAPPTIDRFSFSFSIENLQDCGDGTRVDFEDNTDATIKNFFDQSGTLVRATALFRGSGTVLLVDKDTGAILATETGTGPALWTVDFRTNTFTITGLTGHNNVPGSGIVLHAAGRVTWELVSFDPETFDVERGDVIKSAGKQEEFEEVDWCQILRDQL
jgi:hypothetical protein